MPSAIKQTIQLQISTRVQYVRIQLHVVLYDLCSLYGNNHRLFSPSH